MTKAEEILEKHLAIMDAETMIGKHGRTHKAVINAINEAINYTHSCKSDSEQLKDKVKLTFKNWLFSNEIRYVSEHNYKSNEGDIYDSDELEKMYQHYLSL